MFAFDIFRSLLLKAKSSRKCQKKLKGLVYVVISFIHTEWRLQSLGFISTLQIYCKFQNNTFFATSFISRLFTKCTCINLRQTSNRKNPHLKLKWNEFSNLIFDILVKVLPQVRGWWVLSSWPKLGFVKHHWDEIFAEYLPVFEVRMEPKEQP